MRAARSAAAEVSQYLGRESDKSATARILSANFSGQAATQEDIDASIDQGSGASQRRPESGARGGEGGSPISIPTPFPEKARWA